MNAARWATRWAAGWGVVTTYTSARGRNCGERDRDVAGAGRQIDEQVVGLVPVDVGEELLERLVQHRSAPDDRLVLVGEEPHRDARTPWASGGISMSSMTTGGRSTPSIRGIEKPQTSASTTATLLAPVGERDGQVGRDRRLADAALARGDEQDPGLATPGRRRGWHDPRRDRAPAGSRRSTPGRRAGARGARPAPRRS